MAQVQFNLDELNGVCLSEKTTQGLTTSTPLGVDFPDGTKWRSEIERHAIAAPAASWFYSRGDYSTGSGSGSGVTPCSEHTGAHNGYITKPRWMDQKLKVYVNKPHSWGCATDTFNTIDKLNTIPESKYSNLPCEKNILEPLICIRNFTINSTKTTCSGSILVYNPSERAVRVEILSDDAGDTATRRSLGISSVGMNTEVGPKDTVGLSFSCHPSKLFISEDVTQSPKNFRIKLSDVAYYYPKRKGSLSFGAKDYQAWNQKLTAILPSNYVAYSQYFTLTQYRGTNSAAAYLPPVERVIGKLPMELRHVVNIRDSSRVSVFMTASNPFSEGLKLKFYLKGLAPFYNPDANTALLQKEVTLSKYESRHTEEIWSYPLEIAGLAAAVDFGVSCEMTTATTTSSLKQELYTSLPREVYPVVMYIGDYSDDGTSRVASLYFHNTNKFPVNLYAEIFIDNKNVSYTAPAAGTVIQAEKYLEIPIRFNSVRERVHLYASCYATGSIWETSPNGAALTSRTTEFNTDFENMQEGPSFQSSDRQGYDVTVEVINENDHPVYCMVEFEYEYEYVRDEMTGERETGYSQLYRVRELTPGESAVFSYTMPYDSLSKIEVLYHAQFYAPNYMPSRIVSGYVS